MEQEFDLFGEPVPEWKGKRGRPPYVPNLKDLNKVKLLLALGWSNERIGNAIGRSAATVKRYFRAELRERDAMRDRLDARRFEIAMQQANEGNVAALKELGKMVERSDAMLIDARLRQGHQPLPEKSEKPEKMGKKDQARNAAKNAGEGSLWGDDLQPGIKH